MPSEPHKPETTAREPPGRIGFVATELLFVAAPLLLAGMVVGPAHLVESPEWSFSACVLAMLAAVRLHGAAVGAVESQQFKVVAENVGLSLLLIICLVVAPDFIVLTLVLRPEAFGRPHVALQIGLFLWSAIVATYCLTAYYEKSIVQRRKA